MSNGVSKIVHVAGRARRSLLGSRTCQECAGRFFVGGDMRLILDSRWTRQNITREAAILLDKDCIPDWRSPVTHLERLLSMSYVPLILRSSQMGPCGCTSRDV